MSPVFRSLMGVMGRNLSGRPSCAWQASCGVRFGASAAVRLVAAVLAALVLVAPQVALAADQPPDSGSTKASRASRADLAVTWSGFTPTAWVTSVPFLSTISVESPVGLEPLAEAYSLSTDGESSWSPWSVEGLSVGIALPTKHNITVGNLTLPDSAALNYIRFRAVEVGGAEAVSPAYLLKVDSTPPAAPQNLTANPSTWSNTGSFTVNWTNPADAVGIAGALVQARLCTHVAS